MLTTFIVTAAIFIGISGVGIAIGAMLYFRKKYPSSKRIDAMAEKLYRAVCDFILSTHSGRNPSEVIHPFEQLPDASKAKYRELAKRHFL